MSEDFKIKLENDDALIVMDTNVWLDLYKLNPDAIKIIVETISEHREKFWLPYQVYIEFNRHSRNKCKDALQVYSNIQSESCTLLNDIKTKINQKFENLKRNNIVEKLQVQDEFNLNITEITRQLKIDLNKLDKEYQKSIICLSEDDIIENNIGELHKESHTNGFSTIQLMNIYEEGEIRYKYKVAPGYTDEVKVQDKNENKNEFLLRKYGDLILWKEILQYVKGTNKKLVFVQNERKSDWWQTKEREVIAKVLIEEYEDVVLGHGVIEMMDFKSFLNVYGSDLGLPAKTIKDIVERLNFERDTYKYINNIKDDIINKYIISAYEDGYRAYELFNSISLYGGYVDSVDDFEIESVSIIFSNLNMGNDWNENYIEASVEMNCSSYITEYINKNISHSGNVSFNISFVIIIDYSIDFSNLLAVGESTYDITEFLIEDEEISDIVQNDEFSINIT